MRGRARYFLHAIVRHAMAVLRKLPELLGVQVEQFAGVLTLVRRNGLV